jgi:replication factor C large subunit
MEAYERTSWIIKYKPKRIKDIVNNDEAKKAFIEWINSWKKGKKAALLYGPPGVGKTALVEAVANEFNYDLIEISASDRRSGNSIKSIVGTAVSQADLLGRKRLILLDEVDEINLSEDIGAINAIEETIKNTNYPVTLIANNPWDPKIKPIRELCELIEFKRLKTRDVIPFLKKICLNEGIEADEEALKFIAERNQGDMRSTINDLQALSIGKKKLSYEDVEWLASRDRKLAIFGTLKFVFTAKNCLLAKKALQTADVDYEMLFEWIYENVPYQLFNPRDLANAMDALAKADLFLALAKKIQSWELISYVIDLMTAGVAMAREETVPKFVPMKFPERIRLMFKVKQVKEIQNNIGAKIGKKTHLSAKSAITYYLSFIRFMFKHNKELRKSLIEWLDLDESMIDYLDKS